MATTTTTDTETCVTVTFTPAQAALAKVALGRVSQACGDTPDDLLTAYYAHRAIWEAELR